MESGSSSNGDRKYRSIHRPFNTEYVCLSSGTKFTHAGDIARTAGKLCHHRLIVFTKRLLDTLPGRNAGRRVRIAFEVQPKLPSPEILAGQGVL